MEKRFSFLMFVSGPFIGLAFILIVPLVSLVFAFAVLVKTALAVETNACLSCHSEKALSIRLPNGKTQTLYVDEKALSSSVHGSLSCSDCHMDISMENHPSGYSKPNVSCTNCHPKEQLAKKQMHFTALSRANAPPCHECHGVHSIRRVKEWKESVSNKDYCLTCHSKKLSTILDGERISLQVNRETLEGSVHSGHNCSDCHKGFSKTSHSTIKGATRRELSLDFSDACRGCHQKKFEQVQGSIHYRMLKGGNLHAPVCTDCHGFHNVSKKETIKTLSGVPCKKCHEAIFKDFTESVHGTAIRDGKSAPMCSNCHFAHEVKPTMLSKTPRDTCVDCHKNALSAHERWLPNAKMHFDSVSCTACHVPDVQKRLYLSVSSLPRAISERLKNNDVIRENLLLAIYSETKEGFRATLGVSEHGSSHRLAPKLKALRRCDSCHNADSENFKNVAMAISGNDGQEELHSVTPSALASIVTFMPLKGFYALGATRIRLFDQIGAIMIIGGASIPIVHITLRVLTRRLRRRRH